MASQSRIQVINWLKKINEKVDKVLDVGGGSNPANKYAKVDCKKYLRLDVDPLCKPDILADACEVWCCDFLKKMRNQFDIIFCIESLEHFWNPWVAMHNFYNVLKSGGRLYLSVCLLYPHHGKNDYYRYTEHGLRKMLEEADFTDIEIEPRLATSGHADIMKFFAREGMHSTELREEYPREVPIGFMVRAKK